MLQAPSSMLQAPCSMLFSPWKAKPIPPGHADHSVIYQKVSTTNPSGGSSSSVSDSLIHSLTNKPISVIFKGWRHLKRSHTKSSRCMEKYNA